MRNSKEISKNILATVAYYDVFSYPLTPFEVWKYLMNSDYYDEGKRSDVGLHEVLHELRQDPLIRFIEEKNGFYFLKGRQDLVEERIMKSKISFSKAKRLQAMVSLIRCVPFVRMIGITGRLAMKSAQLKSDWDLLIVLESGHIWMGRTLVTLVTHLVGKRRHKSKIKDRVCLNYFLAKGSMEISTKDLYSANEYFFMQPVFGFETYRSFQLKNRWIRSIKPHYMPSEIEPVNMVHDNAFSGTVRSLGEKLLGFAFLERILCDLEKRKIMRNPKTHQEGSFIKASDDALVFLPELKGPRIFDEFKKKIESLG
ncbi:MAG: hypothetical protein UY41_C0025G0006 [Candidatus Moranbacteria bacterium GW2011_GWE1_49_15]|nr:MAG: hypothetical protein UX75_C0038G0005 [Candidatus Moranbacteria bacterium GW2011_GWE2_47_10]KKW06452.1 MAG: hypothetical protein UY41_C0025G0006 [Candidatus Moranbacteria bacterium GW2011_GWE1_49_15]HBP00736.1 hypothetical protein [Candidatus Moranbacteria bacterium]